MREWHSQNPSRHRIRRGEKTHYFIPFFAVGDNKWLMSYHCPALRGYPTCRADAQSDHAKWFVVLYRGLPKHQSLERYRTGMMMQLARYYQMMAASQNPA